MHQSNICVLLVIMNFWICKKYQYFYPDITKSKYMLFQAISNNCLLPTTKMAFFPHGFVKNSPWTKYLSICKISGPFWESAVSCILPSISFTLPKFNVAPEKSPSNKESSFSAMKCQGRAFKLPVCISKPTASQQTQLFHPQPSNLFKDIQPDFICLVGYPTVFLSLPTACDRGTTRWRSPTAPEKNSFGRWFSFSNGWFLGSMSTFQGVYLLKFGVLQVPVFIFGGVFIPTASVFLRENLNHPSFRWGCVFRTKRWFHWEFDHAGYIKTWHLFKPHVEELFIRRLGAQKKHHWGVEVWGRGCLRISKG